MMWYENRLKDNNATMRAASKLPATISAAPMVELLPVNALVSVKNVFRSLNASDDISFSIPFALAGFAFPDHPRVSHLIHTTRARRPTDNVVITPPIRMSRTRQAAGRAKNG